MEENTPPTDPPSPAPSPPPQTVKIKDASVLTHPELCLNLRICTLKEVNDLLTDSPGQYGIKLQCLEVSTRWIFYLQSYWSVCPFYKIFENFYFCELSLKPPKSCIQRHFYSIGN